MEPPILPPANQELDISCESPTKIEVEKAIKSLRNNKAAGPDNIPAEVLKADISISVNMLHGLLIKIWDQEQGLLSADFRVHFIKKTLR